MNSKVTNIMISILILIMVAGISLLIFLMNDKKETHAESEKSLEEMIEDSFETEQITTDLKDGNYIRIKFRIVTNSEDTKDMLKKDFRLKNIIIKELSTKEEKDFRSGLTEVENALKGKINELLDEGEVTDVFTTEKVLQ